MKPPIPNPKSLPMPWEASQAGNTYWLFAYNKREPFLTVESMKDDTQQTVAARAKMIAASPVMLQTLEEVFAWLMEIDDPDNLDGYYEIFEKVRLAMNAAKDYCESGECQGDGFPAFGDVLCPECRASHPNWKKEP